MSAMPCLPVLFRPAPSEPQRTEPLVGDIIAMYMAKGRQDLDPKTAKCQGYILDAFAARWVTCR